MLWELTGRAVAMLSSMIHGECGFEAHQLARACFSKHGASLTLILICEVDRHCHDDNDDPHDDEGDAEQSGQAPQPPGPI